MPHASSGLLLVGRGAGSPFFPRKRYTKKVPRAPTSQKIHRECRMDRRRFLQTAAATTLVASLQNRSAGEQTNAVPTRKLGRTGEKVSIVGLGGYHIGKQQDEQESIRIIRTALDNGINFFDNCWDYNDGQSEIRMGKALRDGYRAKVFLMTKIDGRTKEAAAKQIDESLRRLQTDQVDLIQFHENIRLEDPDRFFAPGGTVE